MIIKESKIYLILKSGADGNSILDMHSIHSSDKDFKTGQMFILRHIFISVITRQPIKTGVTLLHSTTTYLGTYICRA